MTIKEAKKCDVCDGFGTLSTDYYDPIDHLVQRGAGDDVECENCNGSGDELDEKIVVERIIEDLDIDQENKLQEYFVGLGEVGGRPIINDNCEDMFENWLGSVSLKTLEKVLSK